MRDKLILESESDVEDIIKNYLKENLSVELDWKESSDIYKDQWLTIKILLEGKEICETQTYNP